MAKPIRATPTLNGAEAKAFVESMQSVTSRKPNKTEKKLIELVKYA